MASDAGSAWEDALDTQPVAGGPPGREGEAEQRSQPFVVPPLTFGDLPSFVRFLFTDGLVVRRPGGGVLWCEQWYLHAEVIARLTVVWDEFEKAKLAGTMSDWWLHHFDPHWAVITSATGPFMACNRDHRDLPVLPVGDPDPTLFAGSVFTDPAAARHGAEHR